MATSSNLKSVLPRTSEGAYRSTVKRRTSFLFILPRGGKVGSALVSRRRRRRALLPAPSSTHYSDRTLPCRHERGDSPTRAHPETRFIAMHMHHQCTTVAASSARGEKKRLGRRGATSPAKQPTRRPKMALQLDLIRRTPQRLAPRKAGGCRSHTVFFRFRHVRLSACRRRASGC